MKLQTVFVILNVFVCGYSIKERFNNIHELIYEEYDEPGYFLTGYFSVHFLNSSSETGCGKIDPARGLALMEAMRFAIDSINRNESLLFGAKIGYQLVDTCNNLNRIKRDMWFRYYPSFNDLGVVGPASSDAALLAAPVLTGLGFPVISYAATSVDLADQVVYDNFYRTIPPDTYQSAAIGDLLQHFNWTYVSAVYSRGNYGQRGMEILLEEMAKRSICVRTRNLLPRKVREDYIDSVIKKLYASPTANVVVLFTTIEDTSALLHGIRRAGRRAGNITLVSSTAWTPGFSFFSGLEETAKGSLILSYSNMRVTDFEDYFVRLTPRTANYTWFLEFWRDVFKCDPGARNVGKISYPKCTGKESLRGAGFQLNHTLSKTVITAVHNYACILRQVIFMKYCKGKSGLDLKECVRRNNFPSNYYPRFDIYKTLLKKKVGCPEFPFSSDFLDDRSVDSELEILNFDGRSYQRVGTWKRVYLNKTEFKISNQAIKWKDEDTHIVPISSCTLPCKAGEVRMKDIFRPNCCVSCKPCPALNIVVNNSCIPCQWSQNPNSNKDGCVEIPMTHYGLNSSHGTAVLVLSTVGTLLAAALLYYCFILYKQLGFAFNTLCLDTFALISCVFNFVCSVVALRKPSMSACNLEYLLFSFAISSSLSILLVDAYHINQLSISRHRGHQSFVIRSLKSKVVSCASLIAAKYLLSIIWLIARPLEIQFHFTSSRSNILVTCKSGIKSFIFQIVHCQLFLILIAYYANKARRFSAVRVKAIALCSFSGVASCLVAIFIPTLLWVNTSHAITESALSMIAANATGCIILIITFSHMLGGYLERRQVKAFAGNEIRQQEAL
ncbi:metabotropic glutamate receptor-like [Rhopilema esculentum]|uniref:metabotropic glutamate receptor-like n=1 Tax=Rhopilema esculentum TaxID=499914 RepID=UPI0031DE3401